MKSIVLALGLSLISGMAIAQVNQGDNAPCVVLQGVSATGSDIERCIREPQNEKSTKRYTVVKFFSVFCSDCKKMHAQFSTFFSRNSSKLKNATINYIGVDRNKTSMMNYARQESNNLRTLGATVFFDNHRDARTAYGVISTPTLLVLDRHNNHKVVLKHTGPLSNREFQNFVDIIDDSRGGGNGGGCRIGTNCTDSDK